jgi:hypothetical protein
MSERYIGRFEVMDGRARRVGDDALRTHVASFHGDHFMAEREGKDLRVHMMHDEYGQPSRPSPFQHEEGTSQIRSTAGARLDHGYVSDQSPAELNALYLRTRGAVGLRPRRG